MADASVVNNPARAQELEGFLDDLILKIMINLNERGYGTSEILDAFENICTKRRDAYDEDPDPAEDAG